MGYTYVDYDLLAKFIKESIATELKSHGLDPSELQKALKKLYEKFPDRAKQCRYLLVILECLDHSDEKEKLIILNTAAFYVREQIYESYQAKILKLLPFFIRPEPERSTLFNSLTTSLMLATDNFPDCKDLIEMYSTLDEFMRAHTYNNSDPKNGYLPVASQLFSHKKIKGYDVEEILQDLVKKIANLNLEQIETTKKQHLSKELIGKSDLSLFGCKQNSSNMESNEKEAQKGCGLG